MLNMPMDRDVTADEILLLTPQLARAYSILSVRTLHRDLDVLKEMDLSAERQGRYRANTGLLKQQMATRLQRSQKPSAA